MKKQRAIYGMAREAATMGEHALHSAFSALEVVQAFWASCRDAFQWSSCAVARYRIVLKSVSVALLVPSRYIPLAPIQWTSGQLDVVLHSPPRSIGSSFVDDPASWRYTYAC